MEHIYKILAAAALMLSTAPLAHAEEPKDTTQAHALEEVTVEARAATADAQGLTFTPSKRLKENAQNAYDLVRLLHMPQLIVKPSGEMKTIGGGELSIYINGLPASPEELYAMKTSDVLKVEYLDHPADARYQGNPYVLNYILRQYEWGGYTRLTGSGVAIKKAAGGGDVFSRFAYGRMTYDLYAEYEYINSHHEGNLARETFELRDNGRLLQAVRSSDVGYSRFRRTRIPVTLRAVYNAKHFQMTNKVGFSYTDVPANLQNGRLSIDIMRDADYSFMDSKTARTRSVSYSGYGILTLSDGLSLSFRPSFSYTNSVNGSLYTTDIPADLSIVRDNREQSINAALSLSASKQFAHGLGLSGGIFGFSNFNKVRYTGTSPFVDRMPIYGIEPYLQLSLRKQKIYLSAYASYRWHEQELNHVKKVQMFPRLDLYAAFSPNSEHRLTAAAYLASTETDINNLSAAVQRSNEFLYITGNPALKEWYSIYANMAYTWLPSNQFFTSVFANYNCNFKPAVNTFTQYADGMGVLRGIENDGYAQNFFLGVNLSYSPWQFLRLSGSVMYKNQKIRGLFHINNNSATWNISADIYWGKFYFTPYAFSNGRVLSSPLPCLTKSNIEYGLYIGWASGAWNVRFQMADIFRSSWKNFPTTFSSPLYSYTQETICADTHRNIALTLTYTIGYGKHVDRSEEAGAISDNKSAVLQ